MNLRRIATMLGITALALTLASPALAGRGHGWRGGQAAQGAAMGAGGGTQQRLRDGSGAGSPAMTRRHKRLRDGSCLSAPTPTTDTAADAPDTTDTTASE